jgi:hypothetical protein
MTEKDGSILIKDVFAQFLAEQEAKLAPKTYRGYPSVIELFGHQLDGYAWNNLEDVIKPTTTRTSKGKVLLIFTIIRISKAM